MADSSSGVSTPATGTDFQPPVGAPLDTIPYEYTGYSQTYPVPAGVVLLHVSVWGAAGGRGREYENGVYTPGGGGGLVTGSIPVTGGQVLTINVGGQGGGGEWSATPGTAGWNGGGSGGQRGGGGGGCTSLVLDRTTVIVAGGGGGAGGGGTSSPPRVVAGGGGGGGKAGVIGQNGVGQCSGFGGGGGTQQAGGAGGAHGQGTVMGTNGTDGASLQGGNGGVGSPYGSGYYSGGGGGGGGGYFGGGGGGASGDVAYWGGAGGGGGSSWTHSSVQDSTFQTGVRPGDGRVELVAEYGPVVDYRSDYNTKHPPLPDDLVPACGAAAFPVIVYNGQEYWAWSFRDNRDALAIVAYVGNAQTGRIERSGGRYVSDAHVDNTARTVTFTCQGGATVTVTWDDLIIM